MLRTTLSAARRLAPTARAIALGLACAVAAPACIGDDDPASLQPETLHEALENPRLMARQLRAHAPRSLDRHGRADAVRPVFASRAVTDRDGEVLDSLAAGGLSVDQRDRVARPYQYVGESELYAEEAWFRSSDDAGVERGYAVWSTGNDNPLHPDGDELLPRPPEIDTGVRAHLAKAKTDQLLTLDLELRGFPEWDIPLHPDATALSPADVEVGRQRRAHALDQRKQLMHAMSGDVRAEIAKLGGRVVTSWWKIGWVTVEVPAAAFERLAQRTDLARIDGPYGKSGGAHTSLGNVRSENHLDADQFIDNGFDGEEPNAARHGYGDITIGITEIGGLEDGACAFRDGVGCSSASRIQQTFRCDDADNDGNYCESGTVHIGNSSDNHGTAVTSVAIADYTQGQANGVSAGDPSWTGTTCSRGTSCASGICENGLCAHTSTWENNATGMSPEASVVFFGRTKSGQTTNSLTDMIDDSMDLNLDITNSSWGWGDLNCDMKANSLIDQEFEHAFDDGIFSVVSAGNIDGNNATSCVIRDPADTPKVFAVNAYDRNTGDCGNFPNTRCLLDRDSCSDGNGGSIGCSARGGATAQVVTDGTKTNAVSLVDVVAPNAVNQVTYPTSGTEGAAGGWFVGTSAAAPHVAGIAANVKDWLIDQGQTWINSPGRMHAVMLLMGDRHFSSDPSSGTTWTHQMVATPSHWYGLGRLRMRLFENGMGYGPWYFWVGTYTRTGAGTVTLNPFGQSGMPSGIETIKCVTNQVEDMSGSNTEVSEFKLVMRVREVSGGTCSGSTVYTRTSNNYDLKKVAALEGGSYTNRCVELELNWEGVTSRGLTTNTACYYSGAPDDE